MIAALLSFTYQLVVSKTMWYTLKCLGLLEAKNVPILSVNHIKACFNANSKSEIVLKKFWVAQEQYWKSSILNHTGRHTEWETNNL